MFNRKEIIRRVVHFWIRKERLTQKEWVLLQAKAASSKRPLEEWLLTSPKITEEMLLDGLCRELGCRLWETDELVAALTHQRIASIPIPLSFLQEQKMLPLQWQTSTGTLDIVMPQLPYPIQLEALQKMLPIQKLHFEMASEESISQAHKRWDVLCQTNMLRLPSASSMNEISSMLDAPASFTSRSLAPKRPAPEQPSKTEASPPLDQTQVMSTTEQMDVLPSDQTQAVPTFDTPTLTTLEPAFQKTTDTTFAIVSLAATDEHLPLQLEAPEAPKDDESPEIQTMEEAPPRPFPSRDFTPAPRSQPPSPVPPLQHSLSSTQMWEGIASQIVSVDEPVQKESSGTDIHEAADEEGLAIDDDDFFLNPLSSTTETPAPTNDKDAYDESLSDWSLRPVRANEEALVSTAPEGNTSPSDGAQASAAVLDLLEVVEPVKEDCPEPLPTGSTDFDELLHTDEDPATAPTAEGTIEAIDMVDEAIDDQSQPPQPSPQKTPAPPTRSSSILPPDEELFGTSLSSPEERKMPKIKPNPPAINKHIAPPPSTRSPVPQTQKTKKKSGFNAEDFTMRVVLNGVMGVLNLALRIAFFGLVGYLFYFLFFS